MSVSARSVAIVVFLVTMAPRVAFANHLTGGENDLMGLYGGIALVVGFAGLLGGLGLAPNPLRAVGRRWGRWLLIAGLLILIAGGYHVASMGTDGESLGGSAYGRMATKQIFGTLAVFGLFSGATYWLARRTGVLDMGEAVKYALLNNNDPADRTAQREDRPGEHRIMLIPVAAMSLLALFFTSGVLFVMHRLSERTPQSSVSVTQQCELHPGYH